MRDYQVSKVYAWERKHVAPHDNTSVAYDHIQPIIDYVWQNEGYEHPPKLKPLPKQSRVMSADATRVAIRVRENTSIATWIILHELAHSMTSTVNGLSNLHGPDFMGMYINLLVKYLKLDLCVLMFTCKEAKVDYNLSVTPYFLQDFDEKAVIEKIAASKRGNFSILLT